MINVDAQTRGMLEAVSEGDLPKVSQVLSEGCAVDVQDDELNTALMFAAESEPLIVELRRCVFTSARGRSRLAWHAP